MGPESFGFGGWWIFPIIMCIIMMVFVFFVFGRGGFRPPWMQGSDRNPRRSTGTETPLELLKKRYARGEITREEFEEMKRDLAG